MGTDDHGSNTSPYTTQGLACCYLDRPCLRMTLDTDRSTPTSYSEPPIPPCGSGSGQSELRGLVGTRRTETPTKFNSRGLNSRARGIFLRETIGQLCSPLFVEQMCEFDHLSSRNHRRFGGGKSCPVPPPSPPFASPPPTPPSLRPPRGTGSFCRRATIIVASRTEGMDRHPREVLRLASTGCSRSQISILGCRAHFRVPAGAEGIQGFPRSPPLSPLQARKHARSLWRPIGRTETGLLFLEGTTPFVGDGPVEVTGLPIWGRLDQEMQQGLLAGGRAIQQT